MYFFSARIASELRNIFDNASSDDTLESENETYGKYVFILHPYFFKEKNWEKMQKNNPKKSRFYPKNQEPFWVFRWTELLIN